MADIRDIRADDRAQWEALFLAYGVFYKTDFSKDVLDGVWAWLMDDSAAVKAIVAASGDTILGFAMYRSLPDTFTAKTAWFLDDLYVAPEHRGSGAASALITEVARRATAHGGGALRWITAESNETAQRVYNKLAKRTDFVTYEMET